MNGYTPPPMPGGLLGGGQGQSQGLLGGGASMPFWMRANGLAAPQASPITPFVPPSQMPGMPQAQQWPGWMQQFGPQAAPNPMAGAPQPAQQAPGLLGPQNGPPVSIADLVKLFQGNPMDPAFGQGLTADQAYYGNGRQY